MDLIAELLAIAKTFANEGLDYAVCGGVAVTVHGATRSTKGIDMLVREEEIPRALSLVEKLGFNVPAEPMTFDAGTSVERKVQRVSKIVGDTLLTLDLVAATPVLADVFEDRVRVNWEGTELCVVSLEGLGSMKRLAGRRQDLADLEKLGLDDPKTDDT